MWKRRFSNPTGRDWVLLVTLLWILMACALAFLSVLYMAVCLAICLVGLACVRLSPWNAWWSNRSMIADVATLMILAGVVLTLALTVPGV